MSKPLAVAGRRSHLLVALVALIVVSGSAGPARAADEAPVPGKEKLIGVRLDPLVVSVQHNGVVDKHIGFVIELEVANSAAQAKVQDLMPRINDAFVTDINALASLPQADENGIDPDALKRRLMASCARVLGPDMVKNIVFLRSFTRKVS
jgi:flagellar basal body-associated protein FliL